MSAPLLGLIVTLLVAVLVVIAALAVRARGPGRALRGVDWQRVRDPEGLLHAVSLIMLASAGLIALGGMLRYALRADAALVTAIGTTVSLLVVLLAAMLALVKRRYQSRGRDEQR